MNDVTITSGICGISFIDFGFRYEINNSMISNSFIKNDGNDLCKLSIGNSFICKFEMSTMFLSYVPDIAKLSMYSQSKIDRTTLDYTLTTLDCSTLITDTSIITDLSSQHNISDVKIKTMYINKHEFLILFYIDCDYIDDVNLILNWNTSNSFINSYIVSKIVLNSNNIAFKLYHRFIQ